MSADTNLNAVTTKYGCRLQHIQRNVKNDLQNKNECGLNGNMWDNSNVHQLHFNGIKLLNNNNFISSGKLHNHKKENIFQILLNRTKSQRNRPYLFINHSDSKIKIQAIEQQESISSQRAKISSSTFIKNIINPHTLIEKEVINNNNVTSYKEYNRNYPI